MTARHMITRVCALLVGVSVSASLVHAQGGVLRERREARRAARLGVAEGDSQDMPALVERRRAELALRTALARTVRERLNLTDQQAVRLSEVNARFADERLSLARDEMRIRRELRQAVAAGDSSRSGNTARLLDALLDVQRRHVDLQQREQATLGEFLSPDQRARYLGMMEQLRRRIQQRTDSVRRLRAQPF